MIPNYERAAEMAYRTLQAMKIESLPIDPLSILLKCKNTIVRTYDEIMPRFGVSDRFYFREFVMQSMDAITVRHQFGKNTAYELFYDSHGNRLRRRFTLAHELGHIILKHSTEEQWEEKEADYFASQLLAPRPVLILFDMCGIKTDTTFISSTFDLSKAASEITFKRPINHPITKTERDIMYSFLQHNPNLFQTAG